MLIPLSNAHFDEYVFEEPGLSVVYFAAERCAVCRGVHPAIEEISTELNQSARFYSVDVDADGDLASRCRLQGIPSIPLFKNGVALDRIYGFKPRDEMLRWIQSYAHA